VHPESREGLQLYSCHSKEGSTRRAKGFKMPFLLIFKKCHLSIATEYIKKTKTE